MIAETRYRFPRQRIAWATGLTLLGACAFIGIASSLATPGKVVFALLGVMVAAMAFLWPEVGTLLGVFALYSNSTVLAFQLHGAPRALAFSFLVLFGLPLIYYVFFRRRPIVIDRTLQLMLVFLGVVLASTAFSKNLSLAFEWITVYATQGIVTYFLILNIIRSRATFERVVTVLLCTGALLGALSLYQELSNDYANQFFGLAQRNLEDVEDTAEFSLRPREHVRLSHRAGGPISESNYFAQMLIVLLPFALFRLRESKGLRWLSAGLLASLIMAGILLSYSRGGFLALALIACLALRWRLLRPRTAVAGLCLGILFASLAAPGYFQRLGSLTAVSSLLGDDQGEGPDGAIAGRATEMLAAAAVFFDHPLLGVGPAHYSPYYSVEYQTNSNRAFRFIDRTRRAHSLYLEMAAELGILGLALFLAMVGMVLLTLARLRRIFAFHEPRMAGLLAAGALSLIGFLGTALFLQLSYQRYFWFILALTAALERIARLELREQPLMPDSEEAGWTTETDPAQGLLPVSKPEALLLPERG